MHRPVRLMFAFAFSCVALASCGRLIAANDEPLHSTIRLCSATEPVRDSRTSQPLPQSQAVAAAQDLPPEPAALPIDQSPSVTASEPAAGHAAAAPPAVSRPRMPAGFYPSDVAKATLAQRPGPVPVQSAPRLQQTRRGGKPFQSFQNQPTISPYLYLNAGTNNSSPITNYLAFVRPQLDQQEGNRQQQRELQQLRSQVQKMSSGNAGQQSSDTPAAAHYMDTAQFYRGFQR